MVTKNFTWTADKMDEVYELRQHGRSLSDIQGYLFSKYGVEYTPGRISQVIKYYTESLKGQSNWT